MPALIAHGDAVEQAILILVWFLIYSHTLCMQAEKDLASLHIYTGSPELSFFETAMSANTKSNVFAHFIYSLCYKF